MAAPNPLPGFRSGRSVVTRNIFWTDQRRDFVMGLIDSGNAYDGSNTNYEDELREGLVLARITSTKKWVPCKRTRANGAGSATATLVVYDARTFKTSDTLKVGSNNTCAISSINYSTNTITLSATKTWSDGDAVYCDSLAGSEIPRAVLAEFIKLKDEDAIWRDKSFSMGLVSGFLDNDQILGDLTGIRAATNYLSQILWADQQGAN